MGRIRTIKPEFWKHEDLCALPEATHLLAAALLNYADDFGYFNANPALIRAECCPLREPSVSLPESLRSLQTIGYIRLGTGPNGRRYGQVTGFDLHQKVSHKTASKISDISITWDDFQKPPEILRSPPEIFRPEQGTGNREQGTGNREVPSEDKSSSGAEAPKVILLPNDGPLPKTAPEEPPGWWPQRDRWGRVPADVTDKQTFDVGKAVLGKSGGGQVSKLKKLYRGDLRAVADLLLQAHEKSDPSEWIAGVIKRAQLDEFTLTRHEICPEHSYR